MPVPSLISELTTASSTNSPLGSEPPSTADDYFRAHASFIAQIRAVIGGATNADIPSVLLKLGDYGIGRGADITTADLNNARAPGLYLVSNALPVNYPGAYNTGLLLVIASATSSLTQVFWPVGARSKAYHRTFFLTWGNWVEEWNTSNLVKQINSTDTTAGAMMAVGAFNLGALGPVAANAVGMNFGVAGGLGSATSSTTNIPYAAAWNYLVIPASTGTSHCTQIAVNPANGDIQVRSYTGTWSAWTGGSAIGVGQTWQDVKASRALGTTYTNTTGRVISLLFSSGSNGTYTVTVGALVSDGIVASNSGLTIPVIIPAGATYKLTGSTIGTWWELR